MSTDNLINDSSTTESQADLDSMVEFIVSDIHEQLNDTPVGRAMIAYEDKYGEITDGTLAGNLVKEVVRHTLMYTTEEEPN